MPIPLIAAGASLVGSLLPGVISALVGAKTPEQARAAAKPQYDAMVSQFIGRGMRRDEAMAQADEAIQGAVQEKMQEGALPVWAETLLSVAGGVGGWIGGAKLAAKGAAKALGKAAAKADAPMPTKIPVTADPEAPGLKLPFSGGRYRGKAAPEEIVPDEIVPPSASSSRPSHGAARSVDAEYELKRPFPRRLEREQPPLLGAPEPVVGSGPTPMPKTQRELFRDEVASEARSTMDTRSPPMYVPPKPSALRLPYSEADDVAKHMRNSDIPDMPMGAPMDDADELIAWAQASGKSLRAEDLGEIRRRMNRY